MMHGGGGSVRAALTPVQQALWVETAEVVKQTVSKFQRWAARLLGVEELAAIGQLAQVEAILDFDPSRGELHPYVRLRVEWAILKALKKELPPWKRVALEAWEAGLEYRAEGAMEPIDAVRDTEEDFRRHSEEFRGGILAAAFARVVGVILGGSGEEALAQRQLYQRAVEVMREAGAKLSALDQELLYRHYGEEVDLKVLAKEKEIPYSTMRWHHSQSLKKLAKELSKRGIRSGADAGLLR